MIYAHAILALFASAGASSVVTDCGNKNSCGPLQTCTTNVVGAGRLHGCAPANKAVICKDSRFSCPEGFLCDNTNSTCSHKSGVKVSKMLNVPAKGGVVSNSDFCSYISADLPSYCECANENQGMNVTCSVDFLDIDTIGVSLDIAPCGSPAEMSLVVTEADLGINYPIADVVAGTTEQVGIPGLSVDVPLIGEIGVVMDITINGNVDLLTFDIGLDGCLSSSECGADVTSYLPYVILNGSYSFGDVC